MDRDEQAEHNLTSGDVIAGKYRIEREIGRGGMGVVVMATHIDLDQRVAIKVLQKSAAYNQDALMRFMREARAAAKIRSEHVARVMDVGKLEDGLTYIVMEYLEGLDLAEVLRKEGPLRVTTAADYILQACEGLAAAHAAGIIHRDIKPANLFLARQGGRTNVIKVLDFGVSKISKNNPERDGAATQTGQVFGSPMYMSPEQLESTVHIDSRTDIWALGVVLFEMLTGKPPFGGKSSANIMTAVIRDPPPKLRTLRPEIPASLEEVVVRCLEKDREQRYATVIELAEAIAPFCGRGADDAVNRIYEILAQAEHGEAEENTDITARTSKDGESSGERSDRRRSGSAGDSAEPSLGGSARTHKGSRASAKRRIAVIVAAGVTTLGIIGIAVQRRGSSADSAVAPSSSIPSTESIPATILPPSPTPSTVTTAKSDVAPPVANDVTITFTGAPNDTKVFRGDTQMGVTTTPLRLPRSNEKITLRFTAEAFVSSEVALIPNVDQTLAITLKPAKPNATPLIKRKVPKELEPF